MRFITILIAACMLAACASSGQRSTTDDAAKRARAEEAREQERICRMAEQQRVSDPRCPGSRPRPSRNPNQPLPVDLPIDLPGGLL